jgi:chaperone BCS1
VGIRRAGLASPIVITEDTTTVPEAPKIKTQDKPDSILSKALGILAWLLTLVGLPFGFSHKSTKQKEPTKTSPFPEPLKKSTHEAVPTELGKSTSPSTPKLAKNEFGKSLSKRIGKSASTKVSEGSPGSISLSGLRNVTDSVAFHEGHVLIMTTNAREMLDDALTRPGRVDPRIGFTLATRDQIRDIYMHMFSATTAIADNTSAPPVIMNGQVPPQALKKHEFLGIRLPEKSIAATVEPGKLTEMAQRFADALPKKIFSPAEF